jgi:hypothetical protein
MSTTKTMFAILDKNNMVLAPFWGTQEEANDLGNTVIAMNENNSPATIGDIWVNGKFERINNE